MSRHICPCCGHQFDDAAEQRTTAPVPGTPEPNLARWLRSRGGRTTARELRRAVPSRYASSGEASAALTQLARQGWGFWEAQPAGPRGGRPTRVFVLGE
jgi:hypothetical protein